MKKFKLPPHLAELNPDFDIKLQAIQPTRFGSNFFNAIQFRSKLELRVHEEWLPLQGLAVWHYELITFPLPGGKYTPDFIGIYNDLRVLVVEAKGEPRNRRATRRAFKELMAHYPDNVYCWLEWADRAWKEEWWNDKKV